MPRSRRHTQKEAWLNGARGEGNNRHLYGNAQTADLMPPDDLDEKAPPAFLDAASKKPWRRIIAAAPPGLLHQIDSDMVAALAAAVVRHENAVKLSQTAWLNPAGSAELFAIERNAVRAARQVAELASALGLSPIARSIQGLRCRLLNPDRPFPTTRICAFSN